MTNVERINVIKEIKESKEIKEIKEIAGADVTISINADLTNRGICSMDYITFVKIFRDKLMYLLVNDFHFKPGKAIVVLDSDYTVPLVTVIQKCIQHGADIVWTDGTTIQTLTVNKVYYDTSDADRIGISVDDAMTLDIKFNKTIVHVIDKDKQPSQALLREPLGRLRSVIYESMEIPDNEISVPLNAFWIIFHEEIICELVQIYNISMDDAYTAYSAMDPTSEDVLIIAKSLIRKGLWCTTSNICYFALLKVHSVSNGNSCSISPATSIKLGLDFGGDIITLTGGLNQDKVEDFVKFNGSNVARVI